MSDQAPSPAFSILKYLVPRRLLFGATTTQPSGPPQDLSQTTKEELRQRQMEKWNFDFVNEIPLEGDWEWERVEPPKIQPTQPEKEMREEWRNVWGWKCNNYFNLVLVKLFSDVHNFIYF